jgi:hypothetical protein
MIRPKYLCSMKRTIGVTELDAVLQVDAESSQGQPVRMISYLFDLDFREGQWGLVYCCYVSS